MEFSVKKIGNTFVGEVEGVDLSVDHDQDSVDAIRRALLKYKVLIFRGQRISNQEHINFSQKFGPPEYHSVTQYSHPQFPEILVLSNRGGHGTKPIANGGSYWHSDMSYKTSPPLGSILYALEVPPEGGETKFCDMAAAYECLSNEIKQKVDGLYALHSYLPRFVASRKADTEFQKNKFELSDHQKSDFLEVAHPVVRRHPENNCKALYVNEGFTIRIKGLVDEESKIILTKLYDCTTKECFIYTHQWSIGDVVFWDNRSTMHKACEYDQKYARRMQRTTIRGDAPI
jgi:taurine dioxygenase